MVVDRKNRESSSRFDIDQWNQQDLGVQLNYLTAGFPVHYRDLRTLQILADPLRALAEDGVQAANIASFEIVNVRNESWREQEVEGVFTPNTAQIIFYTKDDHVAAIYEFQALRGLPTMDFTQKLQVRLTPHAEEEIIEKAQSSLEGGPSRQQPTVFVVKCIGLLRN